MADSAMVSAYFFAQKIEDFHPRFSWGVFKHPQFSGIGKIDSEWTN